MQLRFLVNLCVLGLLAGLAGCVSSTETVVKEPAPAVKATVSAPIAVTAENGCLRCHGPFEKLIATTGNYVAPSGEKTSPHRYVPHDSKLAKEIPDCTHCHTAHATSPLPTKGSIDLSKVNVDWCYTACHHEKNFKSCKECHP